MIADDPELIRLYVETRSEAAFAELVQRYIGLVYHAAVRQVGGDTHRGEDVAQSVFSLLARKAPSLRNHPSLAGWLHTATRFAARENSRAERRRLIREQEAHTMHELSADPHSANDDWNRVRPVIDEALGTLSERDREAILLRFFTGLPLAEIGARLDVSENTARMRVERALDKLNALLMKRGVTSTSAALALALVQQTAAAVPAGLAAAITGPALASVVAGGGLLAGLKFLTFMSTTKITLGVAGVIALAATAVTLQQRQTNTELRDEITALRQQSTTTAALRDENQRLTTEKIHDADVARAEHDELVQLRAAREAFRKRLAAGATPAARPTAADGTNASSPTPMVPVDTAAKDSGRATPADTARTLLWCIQGGDIAKAATLLTFEPAEKARLQAFINTLPENIRAEYDSPEKLIAFVISGSPKPLAGVQLLAENQPDENTTVQRVRLEYQSGEVREDQIKFQRAPDGWKQVVSSSTVDRVIAYYKAKQ